MDWGEVVFRLVGAVVLGAAIGLNRDLHGKRAGVRTLGLVALASAVVALVAAAPFGLEAVHPDAISRVIQGVVTGIGFLGAGVIIRTQQDGTVHGLTTAASIWLTACLGLACGVGSWRIVAVAVPLAFLVLVLGGPIEKAIHRRWTGDDDPET